MSNIDKYEYKTKIEVKKELQEDSEVFDTVLDGWKDDELPLKDTFQIKVKDVNKINDTAEDIKSLEYIQTALVVVTVFLIINTIKLTISARKREISIMRLVGASNFSIKLPFVIEGMFLGILGSIIPIIFMIYGYMYFYNKTDGYLYSEIVKLIQPDPFIYQCSIILLVLGVIVGMFGSLSAVRRYLKI